VIVVWLRRDLRLADNPALADAAARGAVVPVFVLDPRLLGRSERRDTAHRRPRSARRPALATFGHSRSS
jgi:deoxyribodipyrimidine photolyase